MLKSSNCSEWCVFECALSLLWQNVGKRAVLRLSVAKCLSCHYPCQQQDSPGYRTARALSALLSTSLQIPAEASWWALSCRDSLAQVLNLIQASCNVRTVNFSDGTQQHPWLRSLSGQNISTYLNHLKINDGGWKNFLWEPLCKSSSKVFYFPLRVPELWFPW